MVTYPNTFNLLDYFEGRLRATGVFEDCFGTCRRKLVVDIVGTRFGDQLKLDEQFYYDDGELQQRTWLIEAVGDGRYQGHAEDVLGVATGISSGAELRWKYKMQLTIGRRKVAVSFDDRMHLLPDDTLINRATVRKLGVVIGTVILAFRPVEACR